MTVDTEALIAAVRAGDIEAAQALLPVDPIVKRAREICARHMGSPSRWLSGEMDGQSMMGAVTEALRAPTQLDADTVLRMARAACYVAVKEIAATDVWIRFRPDQYLDGSADKSKIMRTMTDTLASAMSA